MNHICGSRYICVDDFKLEEDGRVLDSGAGSGVWIQGLAKTVPNTVQVFGTDISSNNFPETLPANVHMSIASSTSLPQEWSNKFNFVHQRFLLIALRRKQWTEALSEIFRVLKPGGAVQVVESSPSMSKGPAMEEAYRLLKEFFDRVGLFVDVAENVDKLLGAVGFEDVKVVTGQLPVGKKWGSSGEQGTRALKPGFHKMASPMLAMGLINSESEYLQMLDKMEAEWDEHGVHFLPRLVTGRKPL
ncbi:S-adenosyl-L-methionine-dependent methyltransferase [Schizopora paradoxa]|uniref:S-adenosyl-L-methionine-dependent methyltransferase n=1 Tax=Schizopora paradoxa TaxID=27342 RepID=A0A0H2RAM7_9AGAM|nr:S-adenosyl-L-methionine-dependent methyltransferase [Schizopora paradoxa]